MRAYRLAGWKKGGRFQDVEEPRAGPGQVLIRMGGAGICHSDLHIMHEWSPETMPQLAAIDPGFTLGHENAGWIAEPGPGVAGWEEGQPVAISPVWSCGRCAPCRSGDDAYCEGPGTGSGGLGRDGGLAPFMVAPAAALVPLSTLTPAEAAPLTDAGLTSYHAVKTSLRVLTPDAAALVIGVGGLGHMGLAYLRELSGGMVIAVDRSEGARRMAAELGADLVLDSDEDTRQRVLDATGGLGVMSAIDFVGIDQTLAFAATVIRKRGRVTVVGLGGGTFPFRFGSLPYAATIGFTFGGSMKDLVEVVALAESGRVRPHNQYFDLDDVETAYQALHDGEIEGRAVVAFPEATR